MFYRYFGKHLRKKLTRLFVSISEVGSQQKRFFRYIVIQLRPHEKINICRYKSFRFCLNQVFVMFFRILDEGFYSTGSVKCEVVYFFLFFIHLKEWVFDSAKIVNDTQNKRVTKEIIRLGRDYKLNRILKIVTRLMICLPAKNGNSNITKIDQYGKYRNSTMT